MNPLIVFTHIPKTAGSSFRYAAEHYFGSEKTMFDYASKARITNPLVREWVHEKQDLEGFARVVNDGGYRILAGHFARDKYAEVFPDAAYVCWIREPVAQVWSHYRHFRRNNGFDGSFRSFYATPRFRNLQSRLIGPDPDNMAFIGLTEHYVACLQKFNQQFSTRLQVRHANTAPATGESEAGPSDEDIARIRALNAKDIALYEAVEKRYQFQPSQ